MLTKSSLKKKSVFNWAGLVCFSAKITLSIVSMCSSSYFALSAISDRNLWEPKIINAIKSIKSITLHQINRNYKKKNKLFISIIIKWTMEYLQYFVEMCMIMPKKVFNIFFSVRIIDASEQKKYQIMNKWAIWYQLEIAEFHFANSPRRIWREKSKWIMNKPFNNNHL